MTTTTTCPRWCDDHTQLADAADSWHQSRTVDIAGCAAHLTTETGNGVRVSLDTRPIALLTLEETRRFIADLQRLVDEATPATSAAVTTLRIVAESSRQDLEALAMADGIDLAQASMADLNRLGCRLGKAMGLTSVGVSA